MGETQVTLDPELQSWVGRSFTVEDEITVPALRRVAATFDLPIDSFGSGAELPPNWYTLFFPDIALQSELGEDGHPHKGQFLPPIPLPRRLFAGRRVQFLSPLRVGDVAQKRVEIVSIVPKHGRSGLMYLLTIRSTVSVDGRTVVIEEGDAVYREGLPPGTKSVIGAAVPAPADPAWRKDTRLDPVLVFRFSAITWNGHRIHYDADYARDGEGYPGCVQNGGLTIQLVLDGAMAQTKAPLKSFSVRMMRPLFLGQTLTAAGTALVDGKMTAWAQDEGGAFVARAELEFGA